MVQSIAKHRYFKGREAQKSLKRYINYLTFRDTHGIDTEERVFFDKSSDKVESTDVKELIGKATMGVIGHELVLSPGLQCVDSQKYARELMSKLEGSLGYRISWVAIEHKGKHNHIHVLIDGEALGHQVRLGRREYRRLREWGDAYLEREHKLERYLEGEINPPYQRDRGDCLFESLFEPPQVDRPALQEDVVGRPNPFKSWDKEKAVAELSDEEKMYDSGKAYTKFNTSTELVSLESRLRKTDCSPVPQEVLKQLREWIGEKRDFGDDHHERLAREKFARQKSRDGPAKEPLKALEKEPVSEVVEKNSIRSEDMTPVNNSTGNVGSSWYASQEEAAAYEKELQDREKQIFLKQVDEDVRLQQKRDEEDEVWRKANEKQEKFLDQLTSENKQFKEWADEARRLSQEEDQRRHDDRRAEDERLDESRREEERTRREEFIQEKIDQRAAHERLEQERADQLKEKDRFEEEAERLRQIQREEDEQLAQERAEQEEWRQQEARDHAERLEQQERDERFREELDQKYDDDKGRLEQYDTRAEQNTLQAQIGKERHVREQRIEQELQSRAAADDCKGTMSKSVTRDERGALRFERRPFRQRLQEDRGRQLQWHIRHQNAEARMRLNQQLEAETQTDKRDAIRQQLEDLNAGEREQLTTEVEPVDLDAIAAEYISSGGNEPRPTGLKELDEIVEPATDPGRLAEQWKSPLSGVDGKVGSVSTEGTQQVDRVNDVSEQYYSTTEAFKHASFDQLVDHRAEHTWRQLSQDNRLDDELSDFLNLDKEIKQERSLQSINPERQGTERVREIKLEAKQETKRGDDELFSR